MKKEPFKMKGYSYPGTSPMKLEPVITAALISAAASGVIGGTVSAIGGKKKRKADEKLRKEEEITLANQKAQEGLTKDISMKSPSIAP